MRNHHTETDVLRLLASFAVALLHSAAARMSAVSPGEAGAWLPCLLNALCRFGVPVFVMISGRYMLSSECGIRRAVRKAAKTLVTLLLWAAVYLGYELFRGWRPVGGMEVVERLLTQPVHLWYFYAAAGLYLMAPMLSVFTRHATHRQFVYGLVLTGISGCGIVVLLRTGSVPLLSAVMEQTKLPYATGFLFCYLLGYYLFRYPLGRRGLIVLGGAGLLGLGATFAGTMWLSVRARAWNDLLLSFYAPNVVLTSAAVFAWVQCVFGRLALPDRPRRVLAGLAGTTGGIYGLHMLVLWQLQGAGLPVLAEAAVVYLISAAVVWALRWLCRLGKRAAPAKTE